MLLLALLSMINSFLSVILYVFPKVNVLPFGIDAILVQGAGYLHYLINVIPPFGIVFTGFMWVVEFKILMMFVRLIPYVGRMFRH